MQLYDLNMQKFWKQFLMRESGIRVSVCLLALVPAPVEGVLLETARKQREISGGIFSTKLMECIAMT